MVFHPSSVAAPLKIWQTSSETSGNSSGVGVCSGNGGTQNNSKLVQQKLLQRIYVVLKVYIKTEGW